MNEKTIAYINKYNKNTYKMYQFRIRKDQDKIISFLDSLHNRNSYLVSLVESLAKKEILTMKEIKQISKPIFEKYGIKDVYLFGSYARGEANKNSDLDFYCDKGSVTNLIKQQMLEDDLKTAFNKDVDIVFIGSEMSECFKKQMMEDLIKLC